MTEKKDADKVFGDWVYCAEHLNPHRTGWCTVRNDRKLGLGPFSGNEDEQRRQAAEKCRSLGLKLFEDVKR